MIGLDSTTLEANAAMESIVRRDTGDPVDEDAEIAKLKDGRTDLAWAIYPSRYWYLACPPNRTVTGGAIAV